MSHPLRHKLALVRSRLRRILAVYGLCCVVTAVVAAAVSLGLTDYLLRLQDFGVRLMLSAVFAGVVGWAVWRYLLRPLAFDWRDVELARRVEQWQPALGDQLRSSVEFLRQAEDDPLAGSPALRRAVITQITAATEGLDFTAVLDRRPMVRSGMAAAAVCLVAAIFTLMDPHAAGLAMQRLVRPFSAAVWPRETQLVLRQEVTRVARGQAFEVEVAAAEGSLLPAEVRMHYRWPATDGAPSEEVETLPAVGRSVVVRRENITRPFAYRVEGGDDQTMSWIEVALVEPPEIAASEIRVVPPEYSGLKEEKADGQIRALVGSRLAVRATANKPLRSAALCLGDERSIPASLSDDGLRLDIPAPGEPAVLIEKSGPYWFELIDRDGLSAGSETRGEIVAVPDAPPSVVVEQPATNLFVTPEASLALRAVAKDDLAIRTASLVFTRSDRPEEPEVETSLYAGPESAGPVGGALRGAPAEGGQQHSLQYVWNLQSLGLAPGTHLTFQIITQDYLRQTGKSEPRRLSVISPRELQDRISARQNTLLAELDRVLQMQRANRGQVAAIEAKLEAVQQLDEAEIHGLQAVEMNQRQVDRSLTSRSDGLLLHILTILEDIRNNKVDSGDVERRMEWLLAEIERLGRECLTENGRLLTQTVKAAQVQWQDAAGPVAPDKAVVEGVAAAGKMQDAIIESLERMRSRLAEGDSFRRFDRDWAQLAREQEDLAKRTGEVGRRTLTRQWKELAPADIAELKVLAGRQFDLARRVDRLLQEMTRAATELRQTDPLAAETVTDACDEAARLGVAGQMRQSGLGIQENQIGQASSLQKEVAEGLQEILDILANRRQHELARLVKKLQESEAELAALGKRQGELASRWSKADGQVASQQSELEEESRRLARRLERLSAERAGKMVTGAADAMRGAQDAGGKGELGRAAEDAQKAEKAIAEARAQLAANRLEKQAELAMEQMAKLEDAVKHLRTQQEKALQETMRFEAIKAQGSLTRGQAASLNDLARLQATVKADVEGLGRKFAGAKGFLMALEGIASAMADAAARLAKGDTAVRTQQSESQAIAKLDMLVKALEPETPDDGNQGQGTPGGNGATQGGQPGGVQSLAELKLLRLMQAELSERTQQLQKAIADAGKASESQLRESLALGEEQTRLAELVLGMLAPTGENEEQTP